jgi:photosystem II stability/assembly factor-like uncharacterized protein
MACCPPRCLRTCLVAVLLLGARAVLADDDAPTTKIGSLAPDVAHEDISNTIRPAFFRSATISPHNPKVAYVSSWDGYVWKTVDAGQTWEESRIIVEQRPFFGDLGEKLYFGVHRTDGANRAVRIPVFHAPFPLNAALRGAFGGVGTWVASGVTDTMSAAISAPPSAGGAGGSNVNFGIGVPGGAPRLQLLVRKLGKPTSGVNMKQTLLMRGKGPTEIRIMVIHPKDPNIVFACSAFGLYRSFDGGASWIRVFAGTKPTDRFAFHIAVDPKDPKRVLLGSGDGLYFSNDTGNSFSRATQGGVGGGNIYWVYFNPYDPKYIFVGTDSGLLRSSDNGATFDYIYFTTFPAARVVTYVEIDPHDKKTGYITTADGLFTTPDMLHGGLESWNRLGGLRFSGIISEKVHACPKHKGHLWTYVNMRTPSVASGGLVDAGGAFIMESIDAGQSWRVINAGNTFGAMQWFDNDPNDPDLLWIIWSRSLTRMVRRTNVVTSDERTIIPDDPPIPDVILAAQMYTGVDPGKQFEYRERANWKALVPRVEATWTNMRTNNLSLLRSGLYPTLPFRSDQVLPYQRDEFRVMAYWNIGDLVFTLDRTSFGRIDRLTYEVRELTIKIGVHRLYGELRRLRVLMANNPPTDLRVRLIYKVRMEELTSYINFITGNYLTRWWDGDRTPGYEVKVWDTYHGRKR